jgi:tryptophan synthase alpha chain
MAALAEVDTAPTNRLDAALARGRPALICYLPLGDPKFPAEAADIYREEGVDVLEIGLPVPNPYIDGDTVRKSMERSRKAGMTPRRAAAETSRLRKRMPNQAMVWMTYGPVVEDRHLAEFARQGGIDGLLFVEPARFFPQLDADLERDGIHLLHLLPRDPHPADVEAARNSRGYVMLQGVPGATGSGRASEPLPDSSRIIRKLRRAGVTTPIALGVGVVTDEHAAQAAEMGANAVIIGSAAVQAGLKGPRALRRYIAGLRAALT